MRVLENIRKRLRDNDAKIVAIQHMDTPFEENVLDDSNVLNVYKSLIGSEFF